MPKAPSVPWTRAHRLIALNLYCKLPFSKFNRITPIIIEVAEKMGRTPNSLAMKLANFASFDSLLQARGVKGLPNATGQDRAIWDEFRGNLPALGPQSEGLLHDLFTKDDEKELDFLSRDKVRIEVVRRRAIPTGPTETKASVTVRRGQRFFQQAVLSAYGVRCCVTGIAVPQLLVASHIRPWSDFPQDRLDPRNGLCLSSIQDAAFDAGLTTFDERNRLILSKRLRGYFPQPALEQSFLPYEGQTIRPPEQLAAPAPEFLAYHREKIFTG